MNSSKRSSTDKIDQHVVFQLALPDDLSTRITRTWHELETNHDLPSISSSQGSPHLSLVSVSGVPPETVSRAVEKCAWPRRITLHLSFIGVFWSNTSVLFLGATPSRELLDLQQDLFRLTSIEGAYHEGFMKPGSYVPHVTLATGLTPEQRSDAMGKLQARGLFGNVTCTAVDLFTYSPPRKFASYELG